MSVRQDAFKYIADHPELSVQDLIKAFPDTKTTTIRRYFYEYGKTDLPTSSKKPKSATKKTVGKKNTPGKSLKEQVFDFLNQNPAGTKDSLKKVFSKSSPKTLNNYFSIWTNSQKPVKLDEELKNSQKVSEQQNIYSYLDTNPNANINDLKKAFPKIKKLVTVFRSWKQQTKEIKGKIKEAVPTVLVDSQRNIKKKSSEIKAESIDFLQEQIKKQKETIDLQKARLKQLNLKLSKPAGFSLKDLKRFILDKIFKP